MRSIILAILILLSSATASANPIDWIKHHKRFLAMEGFAITGAVVHYKGLEHCRKHFGPEPCDEHYGAAWGAYWFTTGVTTIALPAAAEGCWRNEGGKFCNILAYTGSATQLGWGVHEWRINASKTDSK